jgi:hypothetical protein
MAEGLGDHVLLLRLFQVHALVWWMACAPLLFYVP